MDLAGQIGCHEVTVRAHLKRHGIRKVDVDEGWLRREYLERGRSRKESPMSSAFGVKSISRARDRLGIPPQERHRRPFLQLHDLAWLREQVAVGRTHREIAEEIGYRRHSVTMALLRAECTGDDVSEHRSP